MDTSGGGRRVGQGTSFVKGGRGVRSKVGPKIRRILPGHGFCVTSNLQNTAREHKEREDHPRERVETTTNTEHKRAATSRYGRQKPTVKSQRTRGKGSKDSSKDTQRTRGKGSKDSSKDTQKYKEHVKDKSGKERTKVSKDLIRTGSSSLPKEGGSRNN
ncbi:uncharacterized protein LOC127011764 [Drosophila biarmipes]|uniref:uncharacterized protein LOC127011764 n=1 Tax=Drosophila biarmipes TaxID=125945 RepID=UPI0021CCF18E|nr:uncharacterized protein LOC127011764 [Drosophila biarmipes]